MSDAELRQLERLAAEGDEDAALRAAQLRHRAEPEAGHLHDFAFRALRAEWLPRLEHLVAEGADVEWSRGGGGDDDDDDDDDGYGYGEPVRRAREAARAAAEACLAAAREGRIGAAREEAARASSLEADTIDRADAWGELSEALDYALWRAHRRATELFPGAVTLPPALADGVFHTYADDAALDGYLRELDRRAGRRRRPG